MSTDLEHLRCIKCGQNCDSNFQEIFDEVGIELQLDELLERHFLLTVVHDPSEHKVLCAECVNQLVQLFDVAERLQEELAESSNEQNESGSIVQKNGSHAADAIEDQYSAEVEDETGGKVFELIGWVDEQEEFECEESEPNEILGSGYGDGDGEGGSNEGSVSCSNEEDDVDLELYADAIINSNLEELRVPCEAICNICSKRCTQHQDLLVHISEEHKDEHGFYPCVLNTCRKSFVNTRLLATHVVLKHYDLRMIQISGACRDCGLTFSNFLNFNKHSCCKIVKLNKRLPLYCDVCGIKFPTYRRFRFHKQFHLEKRRPKACLLCDRFFSNAEEFFEHVHYEHEFGGRLVCTKCDRSFKNKILFETHMESHNAELKYECNLCYRAYFQKNMLKDHMESYHSTENEPKCEICNKVLLNQDYLRNHMKLHRPHVDVQAICCATCGMVDRDEEELQKHIKQEDARCFEAHFEKEILSVVYLCEYCDAAFRTTDDLKAHRDAGVHLDKLFRCSACQSTFDSLRKVRTHLKYHTTYEDRQKSFPVSRLFMCDFGDCKQTYAMWMSLCGHKAKKHKQLVCTKCHVQFENNVDLDAHAESCKKDGKFDCQFCSKKCVSKISLSVHIVRSHNNKNVTCSECNASYKDKETLEKHIQFVHVAMECKLCHKKVKNKRNLLLHQRVKHANVKRYFCERCEKGFYNRSDMEAHGKVVHSLISYVCEKCPFTTSYKNSLDVHVAMHNNDLQYGCPVCGKHFARKRVLDLHVKRHQLEREFVCSDHVSQGCSASFITRYLLNKHIKTKHIGRPDSESYVLSKRRRIESAVMYASKNSVDVIDADDPDFVLSDATDECETYVCYDPNHE